MLESNFGRFEDNVGDIPILDRTVDDVVSPADDLVPADLDQRNSFGISRFKSDSGTCGGMDVNVK